MYRSVVANAQSSCWVANICLLFWFEIETFSIGNRSEMGANLASWPFATAKLAFSFGDQSKLGHSIEIIFNSSSDFQQTEANYIRTVNAINWIEKIISFKAFASLCFVPVLITSKVTKEIDREKERQRERKKRDCRSQREGMSFCSSS